VTLPFCPCVNGEPAVSAAFRGAYRRGYWMGRAGEKKSTCPYSEDGATWATAFFRFWVRGWNDGQRDRREGKVQHER
jgi:ribosome modulation factor